MSPKKIKLDPRIISEIKATAYNKYGELVITTKAMPIQEVNKIVRRFNAGLNRDADAAFDVYPDHSEEMYR